MSAPTVLLIGATGTVGRATALELAKAGAETVLLGRNETKLEALKEEIITKSNNRDVAILVADLCDVRSIKAAARTFRQKYQHLHALLNIAETYCLERSVTVDGFEVMFATNHLGPFILITDLLDLLKATPSARVITISSPVSAQLNFDDLQGENGFTSDGSFRASKMMNLIFTQTLARKLQDSEVVAMTLYPGRLKPELTSDPSDISRLLSGLVSGNSTQTAKMLARLATDPFYRDANGKLFNHNGRELVPPQYSLDHEIQEQLWNISKRLAG